MAPTMWSCPSTRGACPTLVWFGRAVISFHRGTYPLVRDLKGRQTYVKAVAKYMEDHRVLQRLVQLSSEQEPDEAKMEAIDRNITRAMAYTVNKIWKIYLSLSSPQIKQAHLR
jgi:hypothetical protein